MKKKLTFEVSQICCCVPLNERQWKKLRKIENKYEETYEGDHPVDSKLEEAGASDVEYNGHFGRNVFFSAENSEVAQRVVDVLESIIC